MRKIASSVVSGAAICFVAAIANAAQPDPNSLAQQVKEGLESCGEFHSNIITNPQFLGNDHRTRQSYRYSHVTFNGGVMNWVKYIGVRKEGDFNPTGSGHVYLYTVRLADLTPESLATFEAKLDNHNTGVFLADLRCQGNLACISQHARTLNAPANNREAVMMPMDRWNQGGVVPHQLQHVNLHMCSGNGLSSKDQADILRLAMRTLVTAVRGGSQLAVGGARQAAPVPPPVVTAPVFPQSGSDPQFPPASGGSPQFPSGGNQGGRLF